MTTDTDQHFDDYALLFYKGSGVVGVCSIVQTASSVRNIATMFSNSTGDYLPNKGDYDSVGVIKMFPISRIIDGAMAELPSELIEQVGGDQLDV